MKTKSCSKCGKGTQSLVVGSTAAALECVDNVSIPNCKRAYVNLLDTLKCSECNTDFFLASNAASCTAVTTKIANCMWYQNADTCAYCTSGNILDATGKTCTKAAVEIKDCDIYNVLNLGCAICKKGFRPDASLTCVAESSNIGCVTTTGYCDCRTFHWAVDYLGTAAGNKCEYSSSVLGYFSVVALAIFSVFSH